MKFAKNLVLFVSAVCVVKALVAALLVLLSTPTLFIELTDSEKELRATYEILMGYFSVVVVLLLITSVSLFNQATKRNKFQLNILITACALAVCGAHFAVAIAGDSGALLVQAAQSSIWVPGMVCFAILTSFLISKSNESGTGSQ